MEPKGTTVKFQQNMTSDLQVDGSGYSMLAAECSLCAINHNPSFPGPDYMCRQNNCYSLLVPNLPGPGDQCQHPQPELSLEAGGRGAAAAPGGTSRRLGPPRCEA